MEGDCSDVTDEEIMDYETPVLPHRPTPKINHKSLQMRARTANAAQ